MRKPYRVALVVLVVMSLAVAAAAQAAQPPTSNQSVSNQQASGAQSRAPNETLSPAAQAKLIEKVRHALLLLPYFGVFDNIAFQLQGRTVILQGQVVQSILKPDAEKAVKKVEGVEKVVNNIEVLPPSPMDEQIRHRVYRAIYSYGPLFKYSNNKVNPPIRIIVKNARVTLEGVVDTETDKNLCTMRVNQVPSVLSVTNNLRVVKSS